MSPSVDDDDGEGEETTLYFDAEEGTLRTADGEEVSFGMSEDSTADDEEQEEENEDGNRTPQPAEGSQRPTQTITSMSTVTPSSASTATRTRRPSLARRLSSATQRRVSCPVSLGHMY
jgi:WD repeat-containing protein 23